MKRKTHLENVDGTIYCQVRGDDLTPTTTKMRDVTCKLCFRRYYGLPITRKVT